jgi:hypothetical protein
MTHIFQQPQELSDEQLNKLNTKRLLALYKSVRDKSYGFDPEEHSQEEINWIKYSEKLKTLLDKREHVSRIK